MLTRVLVCAYMGLARLTELAFSRRNIRASGDAVEGNLSQRTYPLVVALHTTAILGTLLRGGRPRWPWLALLASVQPLRYWTLLTLGRKWNARGAVAKDLQPVTTGPYAYIRHPNYAVVIVELMALPAAFGARRLAVAATLLNAALLTARIRDEEALLRQLPGYEAHFGNKPRFIPHI